MYMCLFVSLCVTSGRVFGVCACVHVRVHATVSWCFGGWCLHVHLMGPHLLTFWYPQECSVSAVMKSREGRSKKKEKEKMKKRHQPENDGKTGEVGKMGEDTENNIGKKIL